MKLKPMFTFWRDDKGRPCWDIDADKVVFSLILYAIGIALAVKALRWAIQ